MAVAISVTGLTNQQKQDLAAAFITNQGPLPDGMTPSQFVTLCTLRFWKAVVKGAARKAHETAISSENADIDNSFGDIVE